MIKRTSLDVLPGECVAVRLLVVRLKEQRSGRQQFRRRPVHALAAVLGHHRAARPEQFARAGAARNPAGTRSDMVATSEGDAEEGATPSESAPSPSSSPSSGMNVTAAPSARSSFFHPSDGGSRIVRRGGETRSTDGPRAEPRRTVLDDELVRRGRGDPRVGIPWAPRALRPIRIPRGVATRRRPSPSDPPRTDSDRSCCSRKSVSRVSALVLSLSPSRSPPRRAPPYNSATLLCRAMAAEDRVEGDARVVLFVVSVPARGRG